MSAVAIAALLLATGASARLAPADSTNATTLLARALLAPQAHDSTNAASAAGGGWSKGALPAALGCRRALAEAVRSCIAAAGRFAPAPARDTPACCAPTRQRVLGPPTRPQRKRGGRRRRGCCSPLRSTALERPVPATTPARLHTLASAASCLGTAAVPPPPRLPRPHPPCQALASAHVLCHRHVLCHSTVLSALGTGRATHYGGSGDKWSLDTGSCMMQIDSQKLVTAVNVAGRGNTDKCGQCFGADPLPPAAARCCRHC